MNKAPRNAGDQIPLPPRRLRRNRETDEGFRARAISLAGTLYRLGLQDDDALLDVGCGVGRLTIGLLERRTFRGRYVGFDVSAKHIRWARRNIRPIASGFRFRLVNVQNDRYNPDGEVPGGQASFPVQTAAFDFACLFSVSTHFEATDIARYLSELERVLRPGGTVVATWFLWDEDRRAAVETAVHPMVHQRDNHVLYAYEQDPLWAIAHHLDRVRAMIAAAGLEIDLIEYGTWASGPGPEFQDVVLLRKPMPPRASLSGRVRHRLRLGAMGQRKANGRGRLASG